ncbi:MAG: hypothetical protein ACREOI_01705 [bacterium]
MASLVFATALFAQNATLPHYPYSLVDRRFVVSVPADTATIALPDSFIIANSDTLRLGKLTLQRGRDYRLNYRDAILQLTTGNGQRTTGDSLILTYRILPLSLPRELALFHLAKPAAQDSALPVSHVVASAQHGILASSRDRFGANLSKSGSLTRGVSLGTDQGLKVDSGLRLQISGKLSDKTEVVAALTDQNTPIQPEGNTQTLNEIDKVFVQLKSERFNATLGDFQIEYGGSEFSRYSRKLQGAKIAIGNTEPADDRSSNLQLQLSAAVSRGKFTTNQFNGIEGKQGPYQLQGDRGQIDIIVLAGTERVWIDGQLMTRGENNDYVIEYSNGQLTFTRKRLITSDTRITIDFEFSDERFRRNLYSAQGLVTGFNDKVKWQTTLIREGDDQDNPLEFTLDEADRELLAAAGDSLAFRDGSIFVGAGKGSYIRSDSIWVYVGLDSGDYNVRFSDLGEGRGDYAFRGFGNFAYVGKTMGRYAPVILLAPAVRQDVMDTRLELMPWRGVSLVNELAISQLDQNLYSRLDDADNTGRALLSTLRIEPQSSKLGRFALQMRYRNKGSRYRDIDRADVVEFNRRWNLSSDAIAANEEMLESSANYSPLTGWNLRGGYGRLNRGVVSDRWEAGMEFKRPKLPELQYQVESIARQEDPRALPLLSSASDWLRQNGSATYSFWKLKPRLGYEAEDRRETVADTASGFRFNSYTAGVEAQVLRRLKIGAALNQRDDDMRTQHGFLPKSTALTQNYSLSLERWRALAADATFTHRERRFDDPRIENVRADLADLRVRFSPYQRALDTDWQYQITNTQVSKQQRVYIKVQPGEGNYRFDPDLNDYVVDLSGFGDYVLRVIQTEDFTPVVELRARSSIRINFAGLFRPNSSAQEEKEKRGKSWKDYLRLVTSETFIRLEEKTSDPQVWEIYKLNLSRFQNPRFTQFGTQSLRQDVYLWENNRERSLRYRLTTLRELNNQFLGEGLSRRGQLRHELRLTLAHSPKLSSQTEIILNREGKTFVNSPRQDREVRNRTGTLELSYRPRTVWEFAAGVGAAFDEDRAAPPVTVRAFSLKPRSTYSFRGKGRLSGELEWVQVEATIPAGKSLAYELASGNRPGRTLRWNFALEYRVSTNINLAVSYLGRKEPDRPKALHLGKVEMRAFF